MVLSYRIVVIRAEPHTQNEKSSVLAEPPGLTDSSRNTTKEEESWKRFS